MKCVRIVLFSSRASKRYPRSWCFGLKKFSSLKPPHKSDFIFHPGTQACGVSNYSARRGELIKKNLIMKLDSLSPIRLKQSITHLDKILVLWKTVLDYSRFSELCQHRVIFIESFPTIPHKPMFCVKKVFIPETTPIRVILTFISKHKHVGYQITRLGEQNMDNTLKYPNNKTKLIITCQRLSCIRLEFSVTVHSYSS